MGQRKILFNILWIVLLNINMIKLIRHFSQQTEL